MNREYSENEKEEIVKAFKVFMKKIIKHSAVDYARKVKAIKYREIAFNNIVENKMSLSVYDDGIFLLEEKTGIERVEDIVSKRVYKDAIRKLNDRERKILFLYAKGYSTEKIAKILKTSENVIYVTKNRMKRKFEKMMEEKNNEQ